MIRVEILHVRDPDSECEIRLWVNGVEVDDFLTEDLDPGRGYSREEWDGSRNHAANCEELTDSFREAVVQAYDENADNEFITDDGTPT